MPLPPEIKLQITIDKSKSGTGSKMRSQAGMEEAGKKIEESGDKQGRKMDKQNKTGEIPQDESDKAENHLNQQWEKEKEQVKCGNESDKTKKLAKTSKS